MVFAAERSALRRRIEALERSVGDLQRERWSMAPAATRVGTPSAGTVAGADAAPAEPDFARRELLPPEGAPAREAPPAFAPPEAGPVPRASAGSPPPDPPDPLDSPDAPDLTALPAPLRWLRDTLAGGNLIVRVGVVILFFGIAFLLRYAAEHSQLSIAVRLSGVAAAALVLLGLGWHWRVTRRQYGLALQAAGVGILYLTIFAALRGYALLAPGFAFSLLAAVAGLAATLAILEDSLAFALLGATGGFLAPVLAANSTGNPLTLFGYYALLDVAILAIAWFRAWRALNLLAFLFTFVIGTAWGSLRYRPADFASAEPFLILFFLLFVAIAVLFALRRAPELAHYVDGTLVFGVPIVTMSLQAALVRGRPYALATSAVAFSAFYLVLGGALTRGHRETLRRLVEACLALGVAFATLAIPFALAGRWTAAAWALEGAAALWVGLRQDRWLAIVTGVLLQAAAGLAYVSESAGAGSGIAAGGRLAALHEADALAVAALLVSLGGLIAAAVSRREVPEWLEPSRTILSGSLFGWGLLWWLYAGVSAIDRHVAAPWIPMCVTVLLAVTAGLASLLAARLDWNTARLPALALFPVLLGCALVSSVPRHPFAYGGWWAWPIALGIGYLTLRRDEQVASARVRVALHALALWLVTGLASAEGAWQVGRLIPESPAWASALYGVIPALALLIAIRAANRGDATRAADRGNASRPFAAHREAYLYSAAGGLALYLWIWVQRSAWSAEAAALPLPYVPLLNPLDASEGFALLALVTWLQALATGGATPVAPRRLTTLQGLTAWAAFVWLNALALRTVHHYAGVDYEVGAILRSTLAQTVLTLFWTVLALAVMGVAHRRARRTAWFVGAALLGVVIVKLFGLDLSRSGAIPRIVSFIGVGVLMLVLGYFSPVPPRRVPAPA